MSEQVTGVCQSCGSRAIDMRSELGTQDPKFCDRCFWMQQAQDFRRQLVEAKSVTDRLVQAIEAERRTQGTKAECRWVKHPDGSARAGCKPLVALWGFNRGFKYCAYCGGPVVLDSVEDAKRELESV